MCDSLKIHEDFLSNAQNPAIVDYNVFANYLRKAVTILLPENDNDDYYPPTALCDALEEKSSQDCIRIFLSDPLVRALYIRRISTNDDEPVEERKPGSSYFIINSAVLISSRMATLSFIKRDGAIEAGKSINSQLHLISDPDGSTYETMHSLFSNSLFPHLKNYVEESRQADSDKMALSAEMKLHEPEMGLMHSQEGFYIPEITLTINRTVSAVIKQCSDKGRRATVNDFVDFGSSFLNTLERSVDLWIQEIEKVTELDHDTGTTLEEISFSVNLELALHRIQQKLESPGVVLTLEILNHCKRFTAIKSLDATTRLTQALAKATSYSTLLKDVPINDLLSAKDLDEIRSAVQSIFVHFHKIHSTKYQIAWKSRLLEAIARDFRQQLLKVLETQRLMHMPFDEFECFIDQYFEVLECNKYECDNQRYSRIIQQRPVYQPRIEYLRKFRRQHEQLRTIILRILGPIKRQVAGEISQVNIEQTNRVEAADVNVIEEIDFAYENVKGVECLDFTKEGSEAFDAAVKRYEKRIHCIETIISAQLRHRLATAKNNNEMFRIFSRINALFVRPHIRNSIRDYQSQLVKEIEDDIKVLQDKFKKQCSQEKICRLFVVRDFPPIAGVFIWARQFDNQLTKHLKRVEDVLGKDWKTHIDGQKLKADGDSLRAKLATKDLFQQWVHTRKDEKGIDGSLFMIDSGRCRTGRGNILKLKVNFLLEKVALYKEVRHLKFLGFRVPLSIVNQAHRANTLYPLAVSLMESVRAYERTLNMIEDHATIVPLVAELRKNTMDLVSDGLVLDWESYKVDYFVQQFSDCVISLQEKVEYLLAVEEQLNVEIHSLEMCTYSATTFGDILSRIQHSLDDLYFRQYSNLHILVGRLDKEVESKLAARLQMGIESWTDVLNGNKKGGDFFMANDAPGASTRKLDRYPHVQHEIRIYIQRNLNFLYSFIDEARSQIIQQFSTWQAVVTSQIRLRSRSYQLGLDKPVLQTYRNLLTKLPAGSEPLENAYKAIEKKVSEIRSYVDEWMRYQNLWDLQADTLYSNVGDDFVSYIKCLNAIEKSRPTFDTSDTIRAYGPIIIDQTMVQAALTLKYDSWHEKTLSKFASLLGTEMASFHNKISKSRSYLEFQNIEAISASTNYSFMTYIQSMKKEMLVWSKQVEIYRDAQRFLERQRFRYPTAWLHFENIEGEWTALNEILKRRDSAIQAKVVADFFDNWEDNKTIGETTRSDHTLQRLQFSETKFLQLKEEQENVEALEQELSIPNNGTGMTTDVYEEWQNLRGIQSELSQIDETHDKPLFSPQTRQLSEFSESMMSRMINLPARIRIYKIYEYVKELIQCYIDIMSI